MDLVVAPPLSISCHWGVRCWADMVAMLMEGFVPSGKGKGSDGGRSWLADGLCTCFCEYE